MGWKTWWVWRRFWFCQGRKWRWWRRLVTYKYVICWFFLVSIVTWCKRTENTCSDQTVFPLPHHFCHLSVYKYWYKNVLNACFCQITNLLLCSEACSDYLCPDYLFGLHVSGLSGLYCNSILTLSTTPKLCGNPTTTCFGLKHLASASIRMHTCWLCPMYLSFNVVFYNNICLIMCF